MTPDLPADDAPPETFAPYVTIDPATGDAVLHEPEPEPDIPASPLDLEPSREREAPEPYCCVICGKDIPLGNAPDDLLGGVFCHSFGNPGSGVHDFTSSHEIAEFAICDSCWGHAALAHEIRFRSLVKQIGGRTVRVTDGAELMDDGSWRLPSGHIIRPC